MNKKTITLLLPTLNEIVGFKAIFPKIDTNLFDKILVIDGGSTDGTVEYASQFYLVTQKKKVLAQRSWKQYQLLRQIVLLNLA